MARTLRQQRLCGQCRKSFANANRTGNCDLSRLAALLQIHSFLATSSTGAERGSPQLPHLSRRTLRTTYAYQRPRVLPTIRTQGLRLTFSSGPALTGYATAE